MESVALIVGISTGFVSLCTAGLGVAAYLRASARKEYASQRDMNHLKNNQIQLTTNIEQLWRQNDERFDAVERKLERIDLFLTGPSHAERRGGHEVGK
ncbi:MAG TPA: hypothetical protein V6D07_09755 [Trichocoleus sp.]